MCMEKNNRIIDTRMYMRRHEIIIYDRCTYTYIYIISDFPILMSCIYVTYTHSLHAIYVTLCVSYLFSAIDFDRNKLFFLLSPTMISSRKVVFRVGKKSIFVIIAYVAFYAVDEVLQKFQRRFVQLLAESF